LRLSSGKYLVPALSVGLFAAIAAIVILASVPPVSRDALTHHLYVPKLYLQHGGIFEIPHFSFSYYPINLDLLYLIPLYFGNDILPKFIHFTFALITAGMIYRYLARRINTTYALLGALFFMTIPVIVRLSSTVYVDLGLLCFLFASLLYLFYWIESGFRPRYLLISGIFCGLAIGTKYNGLVGLFLLGLFAAFVYARYHAGQKLHGAKAIGWCAVFVTTALIVFSPWMIRNYVWTGNPVYPLYNSIFHQKTIADDTEPETVLEERGRMSHIQVRRHVYRESWAEIALIPVRVFFQGKDGTPKYFDGKTSPFLLLLPVFAFLGIRSAGRQEKTEKYMLLFFSVLFLLYACAQASIRIRYFSPIIPPLVILSMFGLYNLHTQLLSRTPRISEPFKKTIIAGIVIAMLGMNAAYMADRFKKDQPLVYITGKATREQYIQAFRPESTSFQYANKHLTKKDKIFGLYIGNRGYYSDIPIDFDIKLLQQMAARADSGKDVAETLRKQGFTHLLVNYSLFNHWVQKYSLHEKQILKDFFESHTITEFSKDGYGLLEIISEPESG
jgi:4-amino-4-deoxy-L-arabinose transferase-like glycosyltransferase